MLSVSSSVRYRAAQPGSIERGADVVHEVRVDDLAGGDVDADRHRLGGRRRRQAHARATRFLEHEATERPR